MADSQDDFKHLERAIWQELANALADREHGWRKPVLATVDDNGLPQARTIVLRGIDRGADALVFFTDARSPKVAQIKLAGAGTLVFWNERLSWQLRVTGRARIASDGKDADEAWERIKLTAGAADYLSSNAPGSPVSHVNEGLGDAHNLAIVTVNMDALDWLELNSNGHRRARHESGIWNWVVP